MVSGKRLLFFQKNTYEKSIDRNAIVQKRRCGTKNIEAQTIWWTFCRRKFHMNFHEYRCWFYVLIPLNVFLMFQCHVKERRWNYLIPMRGVQNWMPTWSTPRDGTYNALRPTQSGHHLAKGMLTPIVLNENASSSTDIHCESSNKSALC